MTFQLQNDDFTKFVTNRLRKRLVKVTLTRQDQKGFGI